MDYTTVIFDLDGTVLNNEKVYCQSYEDVLKKHKVDYGKSCPHTPGIGLKENWKKMREEFDSLRGISITQLVHETQDIYHSRLSQVEIRPGFYNLQETLSQEGIVVALATSNDWWLVEDELEDLGLHKYFETVVTGEQVQYKKPAPDIFFETARRLGAEPDECVVIEDSLAGLRAAREAGMKVVAMVDGKEDMDGFDKADLKIKSFEELNPNILDGLFERNGK